MVREVRGEVCQQLAQPRLLVQDRQETQLGTVRPCIDKLLNNHLIRYLRIDRNDIYLAVLVVRVRLMMSVQMSEGCMVSCEHQTEAECGEQSFYTRPGDIETWRHGDSSGHGYMIVS